MARVENTSNELWKIIIDLQVNNLNSLNDSELHYLGELLKAANTFALLEPKIKKLLT